MLATTYTDNTIDTYAVLLIAADVAMMSALGLHLRGSPLALSTATSSLAGLQAVRSQPPDLVVLDWQPALPDQRALCRQLRQVCVPPLLLLLTTRDPATGQVCGQEVGADGYVVRPVTTDELVNQMSACLRSCHAGARCVRLGGLTLDLGLREVTRNRRTTQVTATECKLLHFFMRHPGEVLSKAMLLEAVWGYDSGGEVNLVEQYVHLLRQKLGPPSVIRTVRRAGYMLCESG